MPYTLTNWVTTSRCSIAVELLCNHIFQRELFQGQIRIHSFEATVLMLQLPQSLHFGRLQAAIPGLPLVVCGGSDVIVLPDFSDPTSGISLLQNGHNLRFGEFRPE